MPSCFESYFPKGDIAHFSVLGRISTGCTWVNTYIKSCLKAGKWCVPNLRDDIEPLAVLIKNWSTDYDSPGVWEKTDICDKRKIAAHYLTVLPAIEIQGFWYTRAYLLK